jgi:hypothetical protein
LFPVSYYRCFCCFIARKKSQAIPEKLKHRAKRAKTISAEIVEKHCSSAVAQVSVAAQPYPPVFEKTFDWQLASVDEEKPLVFYCTITGHPTPQVCFDFYFFHRFRVEFV